MAPVVEAEAVLQMRDLVRTVAVAAPVEAYVVALTRATRELQDLRLGASPRASVALYRAAQAAAFLAGRAFVLPDDVQSVASAVLGHRVLLDFDRELRGMSAAAVIGDLLATVEAPPVSEPTAVEGGSSGP